MSNKLEELRLKKSEIEKEIKNLEEKNIREKLQEHENNYLGHCFENDEIFFKIVCAASCNIYSVQIIGFYKEPKWARLLWFKFSQTSIQWPDRIEFLFWRWYVHK